VLLLQAATAASMADSINDVPAEGDGFTYEHYKDRQELWFDFIADTGGRRATSAAGVLLSQVGGGGGGGGGGLAPTTPTPSHTHLMESVI
jgi:hypothetical protein